MEQRKNWKKCRICGRSFLTPGVLCESCAKGKKLLKTMAPGWRWVWVGKK